MGKVRFYKYFFNNEIKPIIMEAESRELADQMILQLSQKTGVKINFNQLIDIRVETPLFGISEKKRNGFDYVWVGTENSKDGWLKKEDFDKM